MTGARSRPLGASTRQIEAGRVGRLERTDVRDVADDLWPEVDVPLPFAAPPGAALTLLSGGRRHGGGVTTTHGPDGTASSSG